MELYCRIMPGDQEVKVQVIKMKLKSESLYHKEDKNYRILYLLITGPRA